MSVMSECLQDLPKNLTCYKYYTIEIMRINDIILPALKVSLENNTNSNKKKKTIHVNLKVKELIGIENSLNTLPENIVYNEIIDFVKSNPDKCIVDKVIFPQLSLS